MSKKKTTKVIPKDFTYVSDPIPTFRLVSIQAVIPVYDDGDGYNYLERALDELRCVGAAVVTDEKLILNQADEAYEILSGRNLR